jgi:5-formyltetrahydrofolate cyclo-ligase
VALDVPQRKAALREAVLAARRALSADTRVSASAALAAAAIEEWAGADCVAAYLSFGDEPPTHELIEGFVGRGVRVLLPVIDGERLDWAQYSRPDEVVEGPLGIAEPTGPRLGADALHDADVVIVPALAVDRNGRRLGRGRGYYDRVLGGVTAPTAAVLYDDELVDLVPVEAHDRTVMSILQPSGVSWVA